jgi:hypothetical protein
MRHLWAVLLISAATLPVLLGMGGAGVAQTSDPQPRSADDGPPPGGCTPIGLTVSGEIVFPMTCKDFIERHKAADRAATAAAEKLAPAEASKAPDAVEAAKAPATAEAGKAPDAAEAVKAPATAETSKVPTANETGKALITGEASRTSTTTEVSSAPARVDASKAPTVPDSSKPEEKDARPAAETAPDEAARPETRQVAVAPESTDAGKSSTGKSSTDKSSAEPGTTSALSKRGRARNHLASSAPCTRFRTYDAASGTYRDFGGRRRSCP